MALLDSIMSRRVSSGVSVAVVAISLAAALPASASAQDGPAATQAPALTQHDQGQQRDREGSGAFVYRRGRYTPLGAIPSATFGSLHMDINNRGEIAGTSIAGVLGDDGQLEDGGSVLGFVKTRRGRVTTFDTPGAGGTSVWGNNNRGQVVGLRLDPGAVEGPDGRYPPNSVHLFVRNRNSRITTVDLPFTYLRGVGDINDRGQIVGTYIDTDGVFRGFRREPDGEITPIDVPGAGTLPLGIDNAGRVVGYYGDEGTTPNPDGSFPPNKIHGFLWDEGRVTTLDVPGSLATYAFRLNNRGQITGGYYDPAGTQHGFVLERGRYRTLTPPGRVESTALGINDRGQIVIPEPTTRLFTVATR